jgi:hypothetical protein
MSFNYLIPNWFFGFDIAMEVIFGIITISISILAFKINQYTKERKIKLFGLAFLLIGLSYLTLGCMNSWFVHEASEGFREVSIENIQILEVLSLYIYMILFISGLVTLAYVTADMKKGITYYLLFGLSVLVIVLSCYKLVSFRILSVFLISFIAFRYLEDYLSKKNKKELWTLIAFILLFFSSLDFILSQAYYQAYIIGHIFELFAYLVLLSILIKSIKNE